MSAGVIQLIAGAAQVVEHYGDWPTFHDGQVLSMNINHLEAVTEATISICDAEFPSEKSTKVALRWEGVTDLRLASTCLDGVLYEVMFSGAKDGIETRFISKTGGATGRIFATRIEVTRYEPGEE